MIIEKGDRIRLGLSSLIRAGRAELEFTGQQLKSKNGALTGNSTYENGWAPQYILYSLKAKTIGDQIQVCRVPENWYWTYIGDPRRKDCDAT